MAAVANSDCDCGGPPLSKKGESEAPSDKKAHQRVVAVIWQPLVIALLTNGIFEAQSDGTYEGWPIVDPYAEVINYRETSRSAEVNYIGMMAGSVVAFIFLAIAGEMLYEYPAISNRHRLLNVANLVLALGEAIVYTHTLTQMAKRTVGELRPNFMERCLGEGYDSEAVADNLAANSGVLVCVDGSTHMGARRSFPSGHSSGATCVGSWGFMYLFWMVYQRTVTYNKLSPAFAAKYGDALRESSYWLVFLPLVLSMYVCVQRVVRLVHHPWDVTAGAVLGLACTVPIFLRVTRLLSRGGSYERGSVRAGQVSAAAANYDKLGEHPIVP